MEPHDGPRTDGAGLKLIELENRIGDLERRLVQFESAIVTKLAASEAKLMMRANEGAFGADERRALEGVRRDLDALASEARARGGGGEQALAEAVRAIGEDVGALKARLAQGAQTAPEVEGLARRVEELAAAQAKGGDADALRELRTQFEGLRLRLDKLIEATPAPEELGVRLSRIEGKLGRLDVLGAEVQSLKERSADASDVAAVARVVDELRPIAERLSRMEDALNKRMEEVITVQVQVRELKERLASKELTEIKDQVVALDDSLSDLKDGVTGLGE